MTFAEDKMPTECMFPKLIAEDLSLRGSSEVQVDLSNEKFDNTTILDWCSAGDVNFDCLLQLAWAIVLSYFILTDVVSFEYMDVSSQNLVP